jgi:hypothetical protein
MAEQLAAGTIEEDNGGGGTFHPNDPGEDPDPWTEEKSYLRGLNIDQVRKELKDWQILCLSAVKRGDAAGSVTFVPIVTPGEIYDRIVTRLESANDNETVKGVFTSAFRDDPQDTEPDAMFGVWQELKRANDLLAATSAT